MKKINMVCSRCGKKIEDESLYFEQGFEGVITTSKGTVIKFIDPTEPYYCLDCADDILTELCEKLKKEKANNV